MSQLMLLPAELVDIIISHVVPDQWNAFRDAKYLLPLRLVCRQFDNSVSKELYRKISWTRSHYLGGIRRYSTDDMKEETATWLFMTKGKLGMNQYIAPYISISITTLSMAAWWEGWKEHTDMPLYFRAGCQLMVFNKGVSWVCNELKEERLPLDSFKSSGKSSKKSDSIDFFKILIAGGGLALAAFLGDSAMVRELLAGGADPKQPIEPFGYPLYAAACAGKLDCLTILLDAGADIKDSIGSLGTAVEAAASLDRVDIVQCLIDRGADLGLAVLMATEKKREDVLKLLLIHERADVNAVRPGVQAGRQAIFVAMRKGYRSILLMLAGHATLQPNLKDNIGRTVLWTAVANNWKDVVDVLLARADVDVNLPDVRSSTPLHVACKLPSHDLVAALLARPDINPNAANIGGRTPLNNAIRLLNMMASRLLLKHPGVDASIGPDIYNTPLVLATMNDSGLVQLLVQRPEVLSSPNFKETATYALCRAFVYGRRYIAELLLQVSSIGLDNVYCDDCPLLHYLIQRESIEGIRLLLDMGGVDLNRYFKGKTALMEAAQMNFSEAVALLLEQSSVDINATGSHGTALACSLTYPYDNVLYGSSKLTLLLLGRADLDTNIVPHGPYALMLMPQRPSADTDDANENGHNTVSYGNDKKPKNKKHFSYTMDLKDEVERNFGPPPLAMAARHWDIKRVGMILDHHATDPNKADNEGRTALWWAACGKASQNDGQDGADVVRKLLRHPDTNPNLADRWGWTPLLMAVYRDRREAANALLLDDRTDPNIANKDGCTPLDMATSYEHTWLISRLRAAMNRGRRAASPR